MLHIRVAQEHQPVDDRVLKTAAGHRKRRPVQVLVGELHRSIEMQCEVRRPVGLVGELHMERVVAEVEVLAQVTQA